MPSSREHRSRSRLRTSGPPTPADQSYIAQPEELVLPDAPVSGQTAELLHEFVHPHHPAHVTEATLVEEEGSEEEDLEKRRSLLPWWKRPSPWWILCALPVTAVAMSTTIAPRIEIYTMLVCRVKRPDIYYDQSRSGVLSLPNPVPNLPQLCAADPVVQAAVAKLSAAMTTTMGILSCLTTGWWGAFSDRYGRSRVMGISALGLLLTDFNFIFVALFPDRVPGGYWFLLLGPLVEGVLGGFASGVAATHAYQADTTNDGNRSRIFSLGLGLLFTGFAVGPTLGSLLIRTTGQVLSVFYLAAGTHVLYTFLIWFILPESLSLRSRLRARARYSDELRAETLERSSGFGSRILVGVKRLFAFLTPLAVFSPHAQEAHNNPLKKRKRDWSLTFFGAAYGLVVSIMGSYTYKFQYAALTFGWTSEALGYWLSLVGAARAFFLAAILPLAIKLLKPKPIIVVVPQQPSESSPLLPPSDSTSDLPKKTKEIHSPAFDLGLARASLFVDAVCYTFMSLFLTPTTFTVFGMLGSMGAAFSPASQAVALALYNKRGLTESGRLFGALSVIQALSSQILGPSIYGYIYVKTVATYPRTIFVVSLVSLVTSLCLLGFVRLPKENHPPHTVVADTDEDPEEPSANSPEARSREGTLVGEEART